MIDNDDKLYCGIVFLPTEVDLHQCVLDQYN